MYFWTIREVSGEIGCVVKYFADDRLDESRLNESQDQQTVTRVKVSSWFWNVLRHTYLLVDLVVTLPSIAHLSTSFIRLLS